MNRTTTFIAVMAAAMVIGIVVGSLHEILPLPIRVLISLALGFCIGLSVRR